MEHKLLSQIRKLRFYNLVLITALIAILLLSFDTYKNRKFTEIDVERINVVEKDGKLKMVISNQERQPKAVINGAEMDGRGKAPGIILYNSEGDECGGFLFSGDKNEAGQILTFDQYKQDQIMSLRYNESNSNNKRERLYGLAISDRPDTISLDKVYLQREKLQKIKNVAEREKALNQFDNSGIYGNNRLFVGKTWSDSYGLFLNDDKGKKRARLFLDKNNTARLEFYDENGKVIAAYPTF